jgi:hypothetical protein
MSQPVPMPPAQGAPQHQKPVTQQQQQSAPNKEQSNQSPINLLIINPSPRKIKLFEVKLEILNQKYDILREKYNFDEVDAYNQCRNYFLSHPEYTHMAILPDDLLVDLKHVDKLVEDLEKYDYDVLSGISNFAMSSKNFWNRMTCIDYNNYGAVDQLAKTARFDYFTQVMTRERYDKIKEEMANKPNRIIRVALSNFPFTIAKRHVIEKIEFGMSLMGVDTVFFQSCINHGIPTYADLDVQMVHIKGIEENHEMKDSIFMAFDRSVTTKIHFIVSNPPKKEQIFLPKIQQTTE